MTQPRIPTVYEVAEVYLVPAPAFFGQWHSWVEHESVEWTAGFLLGDAATLVLGKVSVTLLYGMVCGVVRFPQGDLDFSTCNAGA